MSDTLDRFCRWLQATDLSQTIQNVDWIVPAVQTLHILAIAAVLSSALMLALRLLGVAARDQASAAIATRYLPVIWGTLIVLLLTGAILIIGEPARALENPVFILKMTLLAAALSVIGAYQIPLRTNPDFWERSIVRSISVKLIAILSLGLWIGIVCAGRWIAYVQVD
jgi:hypothetical protein